jgi:para-nitrobenzyl esterase
LSYGQLHRSIDVLNEGERMRKSFVLLSAASMLIAGLGILPRASAADAPVVTTTAGAVLGRSVDGLDVFLGIPYAAAPVGELRWREPQPVKPWTGEKMATEYGASCPQSAPGPARPGVKTSEDCLYLNIWAEQKSASPLPVMVWIHGGGFMFGSGSAPTFDGTHLAKKGVVLVTINYRLGVLGFLAHPDLTQESPHHASGNYGILDQIAALKWVQANIGKFGGDPNRVTIFGESAGSTAVSILQASPLATGLFQRAIGESTSQFDPAGGLVGRQDLAGAEHYGAEFAVKAGAHSAAELRALSVEKLLEKPSFFWPTEREGYVLPDLVYNIFAEGKQNDVPTLVGSNADEGAVLKMGWVKPESDEQTAYDKLYGGVSEPLRQTSTDAIQWQMRSWARLQAKTGHAKAWLYWFARATPGREQLGAFHGAEIVYVFDNLDKQDQPWSADDRHIADVMSSYWVNFATNGDPDGPGLPSWPSYNDSQPKLMEFAPEVEVISTPHADAQKFLDAYFDKRR